MFFVLWRQFKCSLTWVLQHVHRWWSLFPVGRKCLHVHHLGVRTDDIVHTMTVTLMLCNAQHQKYLLYFGKKLLITWWRYQTSKCFIKHVNLLVVIVLVLAKAAQIVLKHGILQHVVLIFFTLWWKPKGRSPEVQNAGATGGWTRSGAHYSNSHLWTNR